MIVQLRRLIVYAALVSRHVARCHVPDIRHLGGGHDGPDDEAQLHHDVDGDVDQHRHQQARQLCGEH